MKNNLRITVFILGILIFVLSFWAQAYLVRNGAKQYQIDLTVAWFMSIGGSFMIGSLLSLITWSHLKPSNFRLK
jgi:hypothetical protein